MPKYLFTSDQRISELTQRIKWVANYIQSGCSISDITDKSDNNNATTLKFYYNLQMGTETCKKAAEDPLYVIKNFVKKFQFPNSRTPDSFKDSINEKMLFAPFRSIVTILYLMAIKNSIGYSDISQSEILYFLFCNPSVFTNPLVDYEQLIEEIFAAREKEIDLDSKIEKIIEWKQYGRQSRELLTVLTYACPCFKFQKGKLSFSTNSSDFEKEQNFIHEVMKYNRIWIPSNSHNYNLANKEYISYMDTKNTPYNVIEFNSQSTIKRHRIPNDVIIDSSNSSYLTAIRTKPFILLAGISGTGKSRIVRKLAQATDDIDVFVNDEDRWKCSRPVNFELIQVKPNWHNSMDVVGFQSNIPEPHYEFTPFIDFIVKAWLYPETPFFLCLDEMNLAPVEEYFAEFLSAIESRSLGEDGEFETDPIIKPFDSFGEDLSGKMMKHFVSMGFDIPLDVENRFRKKGLTLPKNLIVMGTVNMDETTFSFSRKVLDRAMSIEMNEVNYDDFIDGKTEYNIPKLTEQNDLLVNRPISAQEVKDEIGTDEVMNFLKSVNDILEGTPFKLGYRAANEAILYVAADKVIGADNLNAALDDFTLMKILSRIEGDDSKLVTKDGDKLLERLNEYLHGIFGDKETSKTLAKLDNMIKTLNRDHFVSFWG